MSVLLCLLASCSIEMVSYDEFRKSGGERYIHLSDGYTNYELSGDPAGSHTVVLLHGGTIPLCIWQPQMTALHDSGFRILRYDQYGRGFSERCRTAYSRDLYLRQLAELLDSLHITAPVSLIGPSFGGAVAVNFAAHYPQRVRSLLLISPVLNLLNSDSPLTGPIGILRKPVIGDLLYSLFIKRKIVSRGRKLVPGGIGSKCDSLFVRQFSCKGTRHAMLAQMRSDAYGDYRDASRKVGSLPIPVLLLRGKNDTEVTAVMISQVRSDMPSCTFSEIDNSGHGATAESAEQFNRLMIEFLGSH